jgi:hypothetical protein
MEAFEALKTKYNVMLTNRYAPAEVFSLNKEESLV